MTITRIDPGKLYAMAVRHKDMLYISGLIADTIDGSIEVQTREVLAKIDDLLLKGGTSRDKLLQVNIYLPHITDFEAMNRVYLDWLDKDNMPARATVEARLAIPALRVEMTATAAVN